MLVVRDLSDGMNERYTDNNRKLRYDNAASAGRGGEYSSLYAVHRMEMKEGGWWSDGVQRSVCFYVIYVGARKRSLCAS